MTARIYKIPAYFEDNTIKNINAAIKMAGLKHEMKDVSQKEVDALENFLQIKAPAYIAHSISAIFDATCEINWATFRILNPETVNNPHLNLDRDKGEIEACEEGCGHSRFEGGGIFEMLHQAIHKH